MAQDNRRLAKINRVPLVVTTAEAGEGEEARSVAPRAVPAEAQVEFLVAVVAVGVRGPFPPPVPIAGVEPTAGWAEFSAVEEGVGLAAVEPTPVRDRVPRVASEVVEEEPVVPLAPEERQGSEEVPALVAERVEVRIPGVWVVRRLAVRCLSGRGAAFGLSTDRSAAAP